MKQSEEKVNIISKRLKMSIATAAILAMSAVSGFARDTTETIDAQAVARAPSWARTSQSGS